MEMMSYCGLLCHECEIYLATKVDDNDLRQKAVDLFGSEEYPLTLKDINCYGCKAIDKPIFKFCRVCEMRICATEKNLESCGHCADYGCEKIQSHLEHDVNSKKRLDKIFATLH